MIADPFAVVLVLAAVVYVALRLEQRFLVFRSLSAALVGILLGMVLSNTGILPGDSSAYDFLMGTGVSLGIALILFGVDVRSVVQAGPSMLAAFALGATGSAVGSMIAGLALAHLVGPETWKLVGQFTGSYIGGGMNFAALGRAFDTSSSVFTAGIAADVIVTAIWMATCLSVPVLLGRPRQADQPAAPAATGAPVETLEHMLQSSGRAVPIADIAGLVTLALGAVWCSEWLGSLVPIFPSVLWLTTLSLIAAQVPGVQRLSGTAMCGNYLVLLFLASNGAKSVVANILSFGPSVFYFATTTVALHGLFIFGIGRLLKIDMATLAVASQANVGGAASAMAMASARGYADRLLPGVAVGLLGYAVGNYAGFAVAALARGWL